MGLEAVDIKDPVVEEDLETVNSNDPVAEEDLEAVDSKDSVVEEDLNVANANDPIVENAMDERMSSSSEPATATTPVKVLETKVFDDNESVVGSNTKDETFV